VADIAVLRETIAAYHSGDGLVTRALAAAEDAHAGQRRMSGEPYIVHPLAVAAYLCELRMDPETVAAALLHDVLEDTDTSPEKLKKDFGSTVALLVDSLTKLARIDLSSKEDRNAESLRRMLLAMAQDVRVIIIKLADRRHNMQTLDHQPPVSQYRIALETLDIYAPLAHRLGMYQLCTEIEDMAMRYVHPAEYRSLNDALTRTLAEREGWMELKLSEIGEIVNQLNIKPYEIGKRTKHLYSIFRKMQSQNRTFEQIYDVFAFRVIVPEIQDCYAVLGAVHAFYKPMPGRFRDYISMAKGNQYQSLHTTVIGRSGLPFEIQIRTFDMHHIAEFGVAAHWMYKEGVSSEDKLQTTLTWFRQFMEEQSDVTDALDFVDTLKTTLLSDEVFVFTPKGKVITLPVGACSVDFAYHIHSEVGNRCIGAKANGRIVPLDTPLQNGDIIEIITSNTGRGPSRDWLNIVRTGEAKSKIRAWFKKADKEENIEKGREILEAAARRQGFALHALLKDEYLAPIIKRYNISAINDLYSTVGCGGLTSQQVLTRLIDAYKREKAVSEPVAPAPFIRPKALSQAPDKGVLVRGETNMLVRYASCCTPVPGDDIVGYITRGRGVSVHRTDCPNLMQGLLERERMCEVEWHRGADSARWRAELVIIAADRGRLMAEITIAVSDMGIPLLGVAAQIAHNGDAVIHITCDIADTKQLDQLIYRLKRIEGVHEVSRARGQR